MYLYGFCIKVGKSSPKLWTQSFAPPLWIDDAMTFFHSVPGVERILLKDIIEYTSRIAYLLVVDIILTALNLFIPKRSPGRVINDKSAPGYGGIWPKYRKPTEEDSRSCCPALNALANHGMSDS